ARRAVELGDLAALGEHGVVGAEPHGAAEIAVRLAFLKLLAAHPFGHQPAHGLRCRAELGRARLIEAGEIAGDFDHRHLHAEADPEIGHAPLACESRRADLAFRAALAEAAWDENAVHVLQV